MLPPPPQHAHHVVAALRAIVTHSVTLAIEMRTQRAEYVMLRAPRPEYDDNGEVSNTVPFSAERMHSVSEPERGSPTSDADLEAERASVKLVLFPAVIRRGNEYGDAYETEHVVQRMQVLVNRPQLRSESRSTLRSVASASTAAGWREDYSRGRVARLTPITDHSPRTTPDHSVAGGTGLSPPQHLPVMPVIPETTIRLVDQEDRDEPVDDAPLQTPTARRGRSDFDPEATIRRVSGGGYAVSGSAGEKKRRTE